MTHLPSRAPHVAVLGGGMGGLACAHELVRAGAKVTIYEASHFLGGKARSQYLAGSGTGGRGDLPGEHGFRFYPAFYRHVVATMDEIPDALSPTGTVAGNLVGTGEAGIATARGVITSPRKPRTLRDGMRTIASVYASGGNVRDLARYLAAHFKYLSACDERREQEIEATPWSTFIGADRPDVYRKEFREVLLACTRTMVAMDAERGSSRTVGQASCLLLLDSFGDADVDRTLMGPTTECWIDPWHEHLESRGVTFRFGQPVARLEMERGRIARAWMRAEDGLRPIEADAYVLAVPLEAATRLLSPELCAADEAVARLTAMDVDQSTSWMCGAQYFLSEDVPLCEGHLFLPGSPWSLTLISQAQFWNRGNRGMSTYGDGRLRGILSVDVSSCFSPDADGVRLVDETTREGILARILRQLTASLDAKTARTIERAVYAAKLDDELTVGADGVRNAARLLVHPPGSRALRPHAVLEGIPNLYLAADYVKTSMDLASMEGANEAGRLAARGVLERTGLDASMVKTFDYDELGRLERLRAVDRWLHSHGLPHLFEVQDHAVRALDQWRERLPGLTIASLAS